MPLYEYRCAQCNGVLEVLQKFSDTPLTVHEGCGGVLQRLISAPGLHFKGTGWYVTDYAKSGAKPDGAKKEAGDSKSSDGKSSETKGSESSDSKPSDSKTGDGKGSETKSTPPAAPAAASSDSGSKKP